MVWKGCERSVITYSSLISACEKAGHWELAMELFNEMHQEGCTPNTVTYNSLITACAQGAVQTCCRLRPVVSKPAVSKAGLLSKPAVPTCCLNPLYRNPLCKPAVQPCCEMLSKPAVS